MPQTQGAAAKASAVAKQQQDGKASKAQLNETQVAIINLLRHPEEKSRDRALSGRRIYRVPAAPQYALHRGGISLPIGVGMMTFGGLLSVLAAWRYHVVNRDIERGKVRADRGLVILVAVAMAVLSGAMIAFALLTAGQA